MKTLLKYFPWLVVLLFLALLKAQNIDSLRSELQKSIKNPVQSLLLYKNIGAIYYQQRTYDSAVVYFTKALDISKKPSDKLYLVKEIGNIFVDSTNYREAIGYLHKTLSVNQKDPKSGRFQANI